MRHTRPVVALACLVAVATLATGCRDDRQPGASGGSGKSGGSGESGGSGGDAHSKPSRHTSVNADAGKTLPLGTTTRVRYKWTPKNALLDVAATKVRKGSRADLKDASLKPRELAKQPYYVSVKFHNPDKKTFTYPESPVDLKGTRGSNAKKVLTSSDDVKQCSHSLESGDVEPGHKTQTCLVFLLPAGESPKSIAYTMDLDKQPVHWRAH